MLFTELVNGDQKVNLEVQSSSSFFQVHYLLLKSTKPEVFSEF